MADTHPTTDLVYEFSENNSGGSWWLKREHYDALMKAGWYYEASDFDKERGYDTKGFHKGDPVPYGWRHNLKLKAATMKEAVESFEAATGQDFFAEGCNCCGAPFSMSCDGESMSGNDVERQVVRPW